MSWRRSEWIGRTGERRRQNWCPKSVLSGAVRILSGQSGYAGGVLFGEARSKAVQRNGWLDGVAAAEGTNTSTLDTS